MFTSATLGTEQQTGLVLRSRRGRRPQAARGQPVRLPSHARTWVPPRFPKPNEATHPAAVGALAARLAGRLGGRTFVLTTTLRVLPLIAEAIAQAATALGQPLNVLVQGTHPRNAACWSGFWTRPPACSWAPRPWEGIDIPGAALQCVIIDKLPFPPPNDPLVQARSRALEKAGRDAFNDYYLAEAAISLKQGAGRLIRSETDMGLLVIADPRLRQMAYGRRLRQALPPMGALDTKDDALAWLDHLAAGNDALLFGRG